ncbi:MAG TPA: SurA N-terminal domain-containing protein [Steroidobacteraceae bacterium]|nr:SurA N-terminal domain-containing protein [Steroidobacteraceae bacterium]
MLQTMHDHMKGIVTVVLFGLLAVVFIFWGINRDVVSSGTFAIKVNDRIFTPDEVRRAYQSQLADMQRQFPGELPAAFQNQIRENVVEGYIENELLLQRTTKLHYRVGMEDVTRLFQSRPVFQVDGKFNLERAKAILQANRTTTAQWERQARESMQITQLQSGLVESQFVTPGELARSARLELEQREMSYAIVPAARFVAAIAPTDADVNAFYEAHKGEFLTDETATVEYVELKRDDVAAQQAVTEDDLRKYYEENKDRYNQKEKRRARHILVAVARPEDDATALKKATGLYEKLKGGADFAALARQSSDDVTTQTTGGDLDWREAGGLEAPVDSAIFAMQVNELHAPVKSRFGYHILRLDGVQPAKQQTFAEVRADIDREYREKAGEREFGERQEKLADLAFSGTGGDLKSIASALKLEIRTIPGFSRTKGGGALGDNKSIIEAAFSDDVLNGSNSEPKELAPGDVIVLRSSAHKPAVARPVAEVKDSILVRLRNEGAVKEAQAAGDALVAKLTAGAVWDQALADLKLQPTPRAYVPRTDKALPPDLRTALFAVPRPNPGQVVYRSVQVNDGDTAVFAFSGVRDGASDEAADQRSGRLRELAARLGNGDLAAYTKDLEKSATIERNTKTLE